MTSSLFVLINLKIKVNYCSQQNETVFKSDWDGDIILCCGTNNSRGVTILFKINIEYKNE